VGREMKVGDRIKVVKEYWPFKVGNIHTVRVIEDNLISTEEYPGCYAKADTFIPVKFLPGDLIGLKSWGKGFNLKVLELHPREPFFKVKSDLIGFTWMADKSFGMVKPGPLWEVQLTYPDGVMPKRLAKLKDLKKHNSKMDHKINKSKKKFKPENNVLPWEEK
jgi:hypothetical protein